MRVTDGVDGYETDDYELFARFVRIVVLVYRRLYNKPLTHFALEPIYGSLTLVIAMTIIAVAVVLLVTPKTLDPTRRRWMLIARMTAALVLIVACFRPSLVRTDRRPADATLVVALDTSKSMSLPDSDKVSRLQTQIRTAKRLFDGLAGLDATLTVKWIAYDSQVREIAVMRGTDEMDRHFLEELSAEGRSTDLSAAVIASIGFAEGQPLAGVVIFGDGTQTAKTEGGSVSRFARTLDSIGVPLWTIPIGPAANEMATRDVAVEALRESYQMFAGNEMEISFQVTAQGLASRDLPIRLTWENDAGLREEVAVRIARPEQASDSLSMTIPLTAPAPGVYRLIASADIQEGETLTTNNEQIAFVEVREGGGRVFYLEGSLRQEYVFLRRSLRRFPDLDLTARWIPSDTRSNWPVDLSDPFQPGKYDIYILGDLPAASLGTRQLEQLAKAIDSGAGLLMLGGPHTYSSGGYAETVLVDILPVEMSSPRKEGGDRNRRVTLLPTNDHPITRLERESSTEVWKSLPHQLGANHWASTKVAPGVEVILEDPDGQPMMVLGGYGKGRVAAIAFDSTWRWWRSGDNQRHRRFWRQVMLWLLSREDSDEGRILVQLETKRFDMNSPPGFSATMTSEIEADSPPIRMVARVIAADGSSQIVEDTVAGGGGNTQEESSLRGMLPKTLSPGIYRLQVSAEAPKSEKDGDAKSVEVPFQVVDHSLEMSRPTADPVFLSQLAEQTSDQGGRAYQPHEIESLIDTIANRRQKAETPVVETARLGDGPWSGWPMFFLFAIALSIEWYLRRRWNLA